MRVHLCGNQTAEQFADQLLAIEDGKFSTDIDTANVVQCPETIGTFVCSIEGLMSRVYPYFLFTLFYAIFLFFEL